MPAPRWPKTPPDPAMNALARIAAPDALPGADPWADALALLRARDHRAAAERCAAVLSRSPRHFDALHLQGFCAMQIGDNDRAAALLRQAVALNPRFAPAHFNLGLVLRRLGLLDAALASFDRAIALDPRHARAHGSRGTVLRELGRAADALAGFAASIALAPDQAETYSNQGNALRDLGRQADAVAAYDVAIALSPEAPEPHLNRGNALKDLGDPASALACYDRAIACRPAMAEAHSGRGNALTDLGRLAEARASYDAALALRPDYQEARWNRALAVLLSGDFAGGMAEYECRTGKLESQAGRIHPQPVWTGAQDIAGRTLFVYWEQGLGDTIQFCRFATIAAARGARVVLSVQDALLPLLRQLAPQVTVIGSRAVPRAFDFHIALMSLPHALGIAGPHDAPYLRAPADRALDWAGRLAPHARRRIGLAWAGNPLHGNDRNRSMPLDALLPLAGLPAEFVCLQRELRTGDRAALAAWPGLRLPGPTLRDFADTAALLANLDAVVTVDTSIAHLAGALGVPSVVMLPFAPDWRWMLGRDDSPWYAGMRLVRQKVAGEWGAVVEDVKDVLF